MPSQALSNHHAYKRLHREQMEAEHLGEIALLHDGDVVGVYSDRESAYSVGVTKYGFGAFSFEEIGAQPLFVSLPTVGQER
ncbi:hypothetical protein [Candidatus Poriferisodalis sp.]|uniref:hypothetical protein n=1 Tax=Candidatus Poriferisodalis sp. TaxID=3101277 RepID=UPI003AF4A7D1